MNNPFVINTCKNLSNLMLFFYEDLPQCRDARALNKTCGCPVAENACSICEGLQNITRPQQLLGGLVDLGEANRLALTYGIALTCAFTELAMQHYSTGQAECLELPFDNLRRYCGCPNTMDEEESNECTFCPGGEIIPPQSGVDTFIKIGKNEDKVSCEKAKTLAAQTEKDSEVAYATKSIELVHSVAVWFPRTHVNFAKLKSI